MNDPIEVEVLEIDGKDVVAPAPQPSPASQTGAPSKWRAMAWRDLRKQVPWLAILRRTPWWAWLLLPAILCVLAAVAVVVLCGLLLQILLRGLAALLR